MNTWLLPPIAHSRFTEPFPGSLARETAYQRLVVADESGQVIHEKPFVLQGEAAPETRYSGLTGDPPCLQGLHRFFAAGSVAPIRSRVLDHLL